MGTQNHVDNENVNSFDSCFVMTFHVDTIFLYTSLLSKYAPLYDLCYEFYKLFVNKTYLI